MATPIINLIPAFWDNQGLTTADPLGTPWTDQMVIVDPAHPMAAGLTGTISFLQSAKGISYITSNELGTATPALVVETTTAGQYTLIGYTSGQTMANNTPAPEARVGLSGLHNQNANPTTDGWAIFDAAITWATGGGGGGSGNSTKGGGGGVTIVETITVTHTYAGQSIGATVDGVFQASLADHLGSATVSRESDGATITQRYTPFGAIRGGGGNQMAADLTFTGQTDDPGTGLIDYNARAYDPQLGRFIMADPVIPDPLNSQDLNRYSYVRNNPPRFTDPTGNDPCLGGGGGCGSVREGDPNGDGFVASPDSIGICIMFCRGEAEFMTPNMKNEYLESFMYFDSTKNRNQPEESKCKTRCVLLTGGVALVGGSITAFVCPVGTVLTAGLGAAASCVFTASLTIGGTRAIYEGTKEGEFSKEAVFCTMTVGGITGGLPVVTGLQKAVAGAGGAVTRATLC